MPGVPSPVAPPNLNPDRMRRIDRWLGVPACLVLTVFARVADASRRQHSIGHEPSNVLFIELAEMGSTVLACPALHYVKRRYPRSSVFFLLFKHIDESVHVLDAVPGAHVLTIDVSSFRTILRDTLRFMRAARRHRIDTAINLEAFVRFSTILAYLSGARTRVGFDAFTQPGLYTGDLLTHKVIYNPHLHTWQSLLTLVKALDADPGELPMGKVPAPSPAECVIPRITSDAASRARIMDTLQREYPAAGSRRVIVVNPNASKLIAIRKWPLERYAQLVARLLDDERNLCVITGVASERDDARAIREAVRSDRVIDLTGRTSLRELIDLYNVADLLVTNDSGPAHFAALTDIHVVVFFGPETPRLYRPLTGRCTVMYSDFACSPCVSAFNQRRSVCANNRCLTTIAVDAVYAAVTAILEARDRTRGVE
jgi:ADP-heptose:LPS heptosyltransferase